MTYTTPPTFTAGNPLTAAQQTILGNDILALVDRMQRVRKSADTAYTSTTTLANDADLKFTAVAGQDYLFSLVVFASSAGATGDLQCAFSFPAGTCTFGVVGQDTAATTNTSSGVFSGNVGATSGTTAVSVGVPTGVTCVNIAGSFHCTTGGTVNAMFAQATSSATAVNVRAGSALWADRVTV